MDLVLASTNTHKTRELRAALKPLKKFDVLTLLDFPSYAPPAETGKTFEENARLKAESAMRATNRAILADDSGLVVPALGGRPGIFSARFAKEGATDKENRIQLLQEMRSLHDLARAAYFECVIALARPGHDTLCVRGVCEGVILREERGGHGFGYDPLFLKHDYRHTFAELTESVKNQVSHRGKALQKLLIALETM